MKIGITGSRKGVTPEQLDALKDFIVTNGVTELHHGDCMGADDQAHEVARHHFVDIVIHPPTDAKHRAFCEGKKVTVLPEKDYITRNHDIVDAVDVLVALPQTPEEKVRSGTWATIRYARRHAKPVYIIAPRNP